MPETTYEFKEDVFKEKLETALKYYGGFEGKPNHNPYFELNKLRLYRNKFEKGDRTKELFDTINNLILQPPIIDQNIKVKASSIPVPQKTVIPAKFAPKSAPPKPESKLVKKTS